MDLALYKKKFKLIGIYTEKYIMIEWQNSYQFFPEKSENMKHFKGQGYFIMTK